MLKAKYKMHRFINLLYYGIFWVSGFIVGVGFKGGDFFEKIKIYLSTIL